MSAEKPAAQQTESAPSREDRCGDDFHLGRVVIYGVGLLGGSLGLGLLERGIADEVVGIGRSVAPLEEARRLGAVSETVVLEADGAGTGEPPEALTAALAGADMVVLCTPVEHIRAVLPEICRAAPAGAVITDVGSTKAAIVGAGEAAALERGAGVAFVGSHPMAGSDRSGVVHSRSDLFDGATVYLTPTPSSPREAVARLALFWSALGGRLILCRPSRHDELAALTSHLPFLASTAVVQAIAGSDEDRNLLKAVVAGGFRDTTRIAKGHPDMWRDILRENADQVRLRIEALRSTLDELEAAIATDCIRDLLTDTSQFRQWFEEV